MEKNSLEQMLEGVDAAKRGNTQLALKLLRKVDGADYLPEAKAWFGYCLAHERSDFRKGLFLCNQARQSKPGSSDIHLALGRIYLLAGRKKSAVAALRAGWRLDKNREIFKLLDSIGIRKPPVFGFLGRNSMFNVSSGRLFSWIGLR